MEPTDKAILGMASESPGRNTSEPSGGPVFKRSLVVGRFSTFGDGISRDRFLHEAPAWIADV
jgi:hypothetical protein